MKKKNPVVHTTWIRKWGGLLNASPRCHLKDYERIWSTWNWTLHKFPRENMQAGISNMKDIHELIIWNDTCAFRVRMTTVLIQKTPLFSCVERLEVQAFWKKLCENVTKSYLQFRWAISETTTEFKFWIRSQNFANRLILSAKMKKVKKVRTQRKK